MDGRSNIEPDPFLAALRHLPSGCLLPSGIAEALLHLQPQTFDVRRAQQEEVPQLTTVDAMRGYTAGNLLRYVGEEPGRRGRVKIQHTSFPDFLANGRPDDVWMFGMVLLDFRGQRRPVDVLSCMELTTDQLWSASCQEMRLAEYVAAMNDYLARFEDQWLAEVLAAERAQQALSLIPASSKFARKQPMQSFPGRDTKHRT